MSMNPDDTAAKQAAKIRRGNRQAARVILQLFPMLIGLIGLYFISSWSLKMRLDFPGSDVVPYYIGLMLILLALQLPIFLEINRRKTKKLTLKQVVKGMIALLGVLLSLAAFLAPQFDYETIAELERTEWELMHGDLDDDDDDDDEYDDDEDEVDDKAAQ